jgi:hypothetical protein
MKGAMEVLGEYSEYIGSDPLIAHIDANPFGVKTELKKKLGTSLRGVAKVMTAANKAG